MRTTLDAELTYLGRMVDTSPSAFGELRSSIDVVEDLESLRSRLSEDGYVYLPGLLNRDDVLAAREEILRRLDALGYLDRNYPLVDAIPSAEVKDGFLPRLATDNEPLEKVIFRRPGHQAAAYLLDATGRRADGEGRADCAGRLPPAGQGEKHLRRD